MFGRQDRATLNKIIKQKNDTNNHKNGKEDTGVPIGLKPEDICIVKRNNKKGHGPKRGMSYEKYNSFQSIMHTPLL